MTTQTFSGESANDATDFTHRNLAKFLQHCISMSSMSFKSSNELLVDEFRILPFFELLAIFQWTFFFKWSFLFWHMDDFSELELTNCGAAEWSFKPWRCDHAELTGSNGIDNIHRSQWLFATVSIRDFCSWLTWLRKHPQSETFPKIIFKIASGKLTLERTWPSRKFVDLPSYKMVDLSIANC